MRNFFKYFFCVSLIQSFSCFSNDIPSLSHEEILAIGNKIWFNESRMSKDKLIWWNKKENFASLGIGHFIWYPCKHEAPFTQTFPALLEFLENHHIVLPVWLRNKSHRCCPWPNRDAFYNEINSERMQELRNLLASSTMLQTQFIIQRTKHALELMLKSIKKTEHAPIKKQFKRMASSATGLFALIDYINFKGEGINPEEQHNGQGWGLLQVLQCMNGQEPGMPAIKEFVVCAKKILTQRVKNAPKDSHEAQFLVGWKKRIDGYLQELKIEKKHPN